MKLLFILLVLEGVVWSEPHEPASEPSTNEGLTIFLEVTNGEEIDSKLPDIFNSPPQAKLSTSRVSGRSVPLDLSQRLFYANHRDSERSRKTLDLSNLDLSGEDVMKILHGLNHTTLGSIARLDLSHNRVWSLPVRIWPLQLEYSLRELRLDHNLLNMYEPINRKTTCFELQRLRSLKKLSLSHCQLASSDSTEKFEFPPVESLDLSGNRLVSLPQSLATTVTLQHLDVSGNQLRYLSGSPLSSLTGLRTLNLSHNGMERTWDDPVEKLPYLETLHLDHNLLTEPPKLHQFSGSYQPTVDVYMSGNAFKCGCAFMNTLHSERIHIMDKPNVTCEDENNVEWSVDSAPVKQCSPYWEAVREKWTETEEWFRDNRPDWPTLCRSLGWVLFGLTLGLGLAYAHRRAKKTPPPSKVPYNILDDRSGC